MWRHEGHRRTALSRALCSGRINSGPGAAPRGAGRVGLVRGGLGGSEAEVEACVLAEVSGCVAAALFELGF